MAVVAPCGSSHAVVVSGGAHTYGVRSGVFGRRGRECEEMAVVERRGGRRPGAKWWHPRGGGAVGDGHASRVLGEPSGVQGRRVVWPHWTAAHPTWKAETKRIFSHWNKS